MQHLVVFLSSVSIDKTFCKTKNETNVPTVMHCASVHWLYFRLHRRCQWRRSGVFIVNSEHIFTPFSSVSIVKFEQVRWSLISFRIQDIQIRTILYFSQKAVFLSTLFTRKYDRTDQSFFLRVRCKIIQMHLKKKKGL